MGSSEAPYLLLPPASTAAPCSRPWHCFRLCPRRSNPRPRRRRPRSRAVCSRRGTTGRRSRRSSTSCMPPSTGRARAMSSRRTGSRCSTRTPRSGSSILCTRKCSLPGARAAVLAKKPELRNVEPFKTVLSGNREAMAKLSIRVCLSQIRSAHIGDAIRPGRGS